MEDKIQILQLRKSFKLRNQEQLILDIPHVQIIKNEFISIVGVSGCGKTTLLNILAGFIPYDSGKIVFFGKTDLNPGNDRACVFQEDAVFPWMTVRNNIQYGLKRKGLAHENRETIVTRYLKLVNLEEVGDKFPKQLSGGMRKRVDLARAMANTPETILMDEPFGALDYRTRKDLQVRLQNLLSKESKTILFVTHDINEALFLSDRILILSQGPGRIISDIKVPFERPRNKIISDNPKFIELRNQIESIISNNGE
jgi:NitT/TauT family transport system ATP-binding protein